MRLERLRKRLRRRRKSGPKLCSSLDCATANNHLDMVFLLLPPTLTVIRCCLHEKYPTQPSPALSQFVRTAMLVSSLAFMFFLILLFQVHPPREECCALRKECVHRSKQTSRGRCILTVIALITSVYNVWGYSSLPKKVLGTPMKVLIIGANIVSAIVISCLFVHSYK